MLSAVHGSTTSLVLIPFTLLVAGLAWERSVLASFLSSRPLLMGGAASYSMYLLQTPVRLEVHKLPFLPTNALGLVGVPVVLLPLAYFVYLFVEEPSRRFLRRTFAHFGRNRSSSPSRS